MGLVAGVRLMIAAEPAVGGSKAALGPRARPVGGGRGGAFTARHWRGAALTGINAIASPAAWARGPWWTHPRTPYGFPVRPRPSDPWPAGDALLRICRRATATMPETTGDDGVSSHGTAAENHRAGVRDLPSRRGRVRLPALAQPAAAEREWGTNVKVSAVVASLTRSEATTRSM